MLETRQTNRFVLFFFIFFIASTSILPSVPAYYSLTYGEQAILGYLVSFPLPICLYFIKTKKNPQDTLRLHWLGWKNILLLILIGIAIQPIVAFFSFLTNLFFPNPVAEATDAIHSSNFFMMLLSIAVFPAFFEEIVMRGIILSGYRLLGTIKASLATALLFAMLHMNPQQFLYAFGMGFLFCIFVQRTNSIFSSIIPHFIINGSNVYNIFSSSADVSSSAPAPSVTMVFLAVSLLAALSIPFLIGLFYLFFKVNPAPAKKEMPSDTACAEDSMPKARFFTPSILILCVIFLLLGVLPYLF